LGLTLVASFVENSAARGLAIEIDNSVEDRDSLVIVWREGTRGYFLLFFLSQMIEIYLTNFLSENQKYHYI
jgi:hypothetical protein